MDSAMTAQSGTDDGATPVHTLNWTCLLTPAGTLPVDDGPECQACRIQVTREALALTEERQE
jgi:hypothetical protein